MSGSHLLQFATRGWSEVELAVLLSRLPAGRRPVLLAGNDAALSGLAEARTRAARDARVALHLLIAVGVDAVRRTARAFGAGIAGLVNVHDPDVVTLAGLAPALRAAAPEAFDDAYRRGLMSFLRDQPPPIRDGLHRHDGPVRGAVSLGVEHLTSPAALAEWAG